MDSWRELQKNSALSWVRKYEKEKAKRIEVEQKYEALVEKVKAAALDKYYEKLKELAEEAGEEWEDDSYQYELWNYASDDRPTEEEKQKNLKEYLNKLKEYP